MNLSLRIFVFLVALVVVRLDASAQSRLVDIPFYDGCETSGSYTAEWAKQSRHKAVTLETRRKSFAAMTLANRERVSDFDFFPSMFQTCGMGFHEGLAKVRENGNVGFIDESGKIVIQLRFSDATRFSEGLAGVELANGKWGYIDRSGKLMLKATYDWVLRFKEGRALVQIGDKWGYIDKTGKLIVPAKYEHAWPFSEGLAAVQIRGLEPVSKIDDHMMTGYIDKSGKLVIEHKFGGNGPFMEGKALIDMNVVHPEKGGYYTACFWINRDGKIIGDELISCNQPSETEVVKRDIDVIFDYDYRVGYKRSDGKVIWELSK